MEIMGENMPFMFCVCVSAGMHFSVPSCRLMCCLLLYVCAHSQIGRLRLFVCVDGGIGEEESASVCDLPGPDSQADQQCCVRDMC